MFGLSTELIRYLATVKCSRVMMFRALALRQSGSCFGVPSLPVRVKTCVKYLSFGSFVSFGSLSVCVKTSWAYKASLSSCTKKKGKTEKMTKLQKLTFCHERSCQRRST